MSSQYFPSYVASKNNIKVVLDLKGYVKETDSNLVKKADLSYFWGKNSYREHSLVFEVKGEYFNDNEQKSNSKDINIWKSKGISGQFFDTESIVFSKDVIKMSSPIKHACVKFDNDYISFTQRKENMVNTGAIVNIYIVYKVSSKGITSSNALKNSLFGTTKVTMPTNTKDPQKYIYSGYGLAFDSTNSFKHPEGDGKKMLVIL